MVHHTNEKEELRNVRVRSCVRSQVSCERQPAIKSCEMRPNQANALHSSRIGLHAK